MWVFCLCVCFCPFLFVVHAIFVVLDSVCYNGSQIKHTHTHIHAQSVLEAFDLHIGGKCSDDSFRNDSCLHLHNIKEERGSVFEAVRVQLSQSVITGWFVVRTNRHIATPTVHSPLTSCWGCVKKRGWSKGIFHLLMSERKRRRATPSRTSSPSNSRSIDCRSHGFCWIWAHPLMVEVNWENVGNRLCVESDSRQNCLT